MDDQDKSPDYLRGFTAGYQQAKAEELAHYAAMVQSGREIYDRVIRGLIEVPSFADREAARLDTLREAHAAQLHVGRPVLDVSGRKGCPVCMEARATVVASPCRCGHPVGDHGVDGCSWFEISVPRQASDGPCPCRHTDDMLINRGPVPAHNGHYGVSRVTDGGHLVSVETGECFGSCPADDGHSRAGGTSDPLGCSFHRERGDGHVPSCGACVLVTQRAARGGADV